MLTAMRYSLKIIKYYQKNLSNLLTKKDVSNEDKTDTIKVSQSEQPSTSEITPSPEPLVASNEVLALEIEKTTIGIIKSDTTETTEVVTVQIAVVNEVPIVEDEAQNAEQDLINISAVAAESSQTVINLILIKILLYLNKLFFFD